MNNEVKFKVGDDSQYMSVVNENMIEESALYFVSKEISNDNEVQFGGTIYKGLEALGTTCADHLKTVESIPIAGGPLANNVVETSDTWPSDWKDDSGNKIIPAGKSVQEILSALFLKIINGSVSWSSPTWNPSCAAPSITALDSSTFEVGTVVEISCIPNGTINNNVRYSTLTASEGYFEEIGGEWKNTAKTIKNNGTVSGTPSVSWNWNGEETTDTQFIINEGTNTLTATQSGITASVDALPETLVYASTNTKTILPNITAKLADTKPDDKLLTSTSSMKINGKYKYFVGYYSNEVFMNKEYTTESIKVTDVDKSDWMNGKTINYTVNVPAGTKGMYIAIPAGIDDDGKSLQVKQVNTNAYVNDEMVTNKKTLSLTCGGTHNKDYVIFTWSFPGGTANVEPFEITSF